RGWTQGAMTSADAFSHYYSHFTRDQDHFESQLARLKTPVKVVWGEKDLYINKEMGVEFAERVRAKLTLLPGIGHFPHLQNPMLCQIASNCDPLFAAKNDPFDGAETGGAEPHIAEQSRSWRAASGEREVMRGS
ncbi:MAG: alpha/beta hydrolase, partial [Pseudolabrys sp.]